MFSGGRENGYRSIEIVTGPNLDSILTIKKQVLVLVEKIISGTRESDENVGICDGFFCIDPKIRFNWEKCLETGTKIKIISPVPNKPTKNAELTKSAGLTKSAKPTKNPPAHICRRIRFSYIRITLPKQNRDADTEQGAHEYLELCMTDEFFELFFRGKCLVTDALKDFNHLV